MEYHSYFRFLDLPRQNLPPIHSSGIQVYFESMQENSKIDGRPTNFSSLSHQEQINQLMTENAELRKFNYDFGISINKKMDEIEKDLIKFEKENERLLLIKNGLSVERDACIGLVVDLAVAHGLKTGLSGTDTVVVELPSGQVSWKFSADEAHLFAGLPPWVGKVEEMPIEEKYRRVMNSELRTSMT